VLEKFYFDTGCEMKNTLHIKPHSSTKFYASCPVFKQACPQKKRCSELDHNDAEALVSLVAYFL